jgi:N-methylhydantoinase A
MDPGEQNRTFAELEDKARRQLIDEGFAADRTTLERSIGMRYVAQVSYLEIPVPRRELDQAAMDQLLKDFETVYAQRYGEGAGYREAGIEVLKQRVRAVGLLPAIEVARSKKSRKRLEGARKGERPVYWWERERFEETPIYNGDLLATGHKVEGPAIIELAYTTVPVRPNQSAAIDSYGNLALKVG